jgi:hypothetical protein
MRNSISRIELLTQEHARLNAAVDKLSSRRFLTPDDEINLRSMKIHKLRIKDAISELQKETN